MNKFTKARNVPALDWQNKLTCKMVS